LIFKQSPESVPIEYLILNQLELGLGNWQCFANQMAILNM